jgi:hypothetical protein
LLNDGVNVSGYRLASNGRKQEDNEQSSTWKVAIITCFDRHFYGLTKKTADFVPRIVSLLV